MSMTSDIYKIVIASVVAAVLSIILKRENPVFALFVGVVMTVLVLVFIFPRLTTVFDVLAEIGESSSAGSEHILLIMKIIGIAYISEFGINLCLDAGEGALAANIGLAGKVIIMSVSAPIVISLLNLVVNMIP